MENNKHILSLCEMANVLLDTGSIAISTATLLNEEDYALVNHVIEDYKVIKVWVGEKPEGLAVDIIINPREEKQSVAKIKEYLKEQGILYKGV